MRQVKCIETYHDRNNIKKLTEGRYYDILQPSSPLRDCWYVRTDTGTKAWFSKSRFEEVNPEQSEDNMTTVAKSGCHCDTKEDWREYSFSIRSKDQIDVAHIEQDLSVKEPMMILEVPGENYVRVFLHNSIWDKACTCGETFKESYHGIEYTEHRYNERLERYTSYEGGGMWVHRRFLKGLIKLVKEIKNAEWNNKCKATVTVRRIKI